jgi:hypothetical protein
MILLLCLISILRLEDNYIEMKCSKVVRTSRVKTESIFSLVWITNGHIFESVKGDAMLNFYNSTVVSPFVDVVTDVVSFKTRPPYNFEQQ